jgi:hypothetical protein
VPHDNFTSVTADGDPVASPEIVMFFLGPDGEPLSDPDVPRQRTIGEVYRTWREALDEEREDEEYHRHRPPDRKVQGIGRPGKTGYRDEIVVTPRSAPMPAVTEAIEGNLFEPPIDWLRIDLESIQTNRYELRWRVQIRISPWQRRRATLRLYASPSLNVSVLSLRPLKPRGIARTKFLRVGLRVMNRLRDRIDERVDIRSEADHRRSV